MSGRLLLHAVITVPAFVLAGVLAPRAYADDTPRYDAASNYAIHCMGCHRADGRGSPPEVPSLAADFGRLLRTESGREYVMRVPGVNGSPLSNRETSAVLNWLVLAYVPRADAAAIAPFTEADVAAVRHQPLLNVRAERARVLANQPLSQRLLSARHPAAPQAP